MTRLLVCGSRQFSDEQLMRECITSFIHKYGTPEVLIQGAARGADLMADRMGLEFGIPVLEFPADWTRYGKRAGFRRNEQMLTEGKPTHVIAFYAGERSAGTQMMVKIARAAGVLVCERGLRS